MKWRLHLKCYCSYWFEILICVCNSGASGFQVDYGPSHTAVVLVATLWQAVPVSSESLRNSILCPAVSVLLVVLAGLPGQCGPGPVFKKLPVTTQLEVQVATP